MIKYDELINLLAGNVQHIPLKLQPEQPTLGYWEQLELDKFIKSTHM